MQPSPHVHRSTPAQACPCYFREICVTFLGSQTSAILGPWSSMFPAWWSTIGAVPTEAVIYTVRMDRAHLECYGALGRFSKGPMCDSWIALTVCLATCIAVYVKCLSMMAVVRVPPQKARFPCFPEGKIAALSQQWIWVCLPSLVSLCWTCCVHVMAHCRLGFFSPWA